MEGSESTHFFTRCPACGTRTAEECELFLNDWGNLFNRYKLIGRFSSNEDIDNIMHIHENRAINELAIVQGRKIPATWSPFFSALYRLFPDTLPHSGLMSVEGEFVRDLVYDAKGADADEERLRTVGKLRGQRTTQTKLLKQYKELFVEDAQTFGDVKFAIVPDGISDLQLERAIGADLQRATETLVRFIYDVETGGSLERFDRGLFGWLRYCYLNTEAQSARDKRDLFVCLLSIKLHQLTGGNVECGDFDESKHAGLCSAYVDACRKQVTNIADISYVTSFASCCLESAVYEILFQVLQIAKRVKAPGASKLLPWIADPNRVHQGKFSDFSKLIYDLKGSHGLELSARPQSGNGKLPLAANTRNLLRLTALALVAPYAEKVTDSLALFETKPGPITLADVNNLIAKVVGEKNLLVLVEEDDPQPDDSYSRTELFFHDVRLLTVDIEHNVHAKVVEIQSSVKFINLGDALAFNYTFRAEQLKAYAAGIGKIRNSQSHSKDISQKLHIAYEVLGFMDFTDVYLSRKLVQGAGTYDKGVPDPQTLVPVFMELFGKESSREDVKLLEQVLQKRKDKQNISEEDMQAVYVIVQGIMPDNRESFDRFKEKFRVVGDIPVRGVLKYLEALPKFLTSNPKLVKRIVKTFVPNTEAVQALIRIQDEITLAKDIEDTKEGLLKFLEVIEERTNVSGGRRRVVQARF